MTELETLFKQRIRNIPDYPKKGIMFRDITPLLKDQHAFKTCTEELAREFSKEKVDYVIGIEARGFIIGAAVAHAMHVGFIPIRKKGKLPHKTISKEYDLEYGRETIEMHEDGVEKGSRVLLIDDLLATGGTAKAAADLLRQVGAIIVGFGFVIELTELKGRDLLQGARVFSLVRY